MNTTTDYEQLWSGEWSELQRIGPLTHTNHRLVVKALKPYIFKGARLLDVGCGNGSLLELLCNRFPEIEPTGIEGAAEAVARAPESLRGRILRQDLSNGFSLAGEPFDIVTCSEVLEHLENYLPTLDSIVSHTRAGGWVLITVPHSMRYWSKSDEFAGHHRRFEYEDLRADLKQCGLKVVQYFTWGFPVSYIYNRIVTRIEPGALMQQKPSALKTFIAKSVYQAMRLDDLFTGRRWHQLIALAQKDIRSDGTAR